MGIRRERRKERASLSTVLHEYIRAAIVVIFSRCAGPLGKLWSGPMLGNAEKGVERRPI